MSNFESYLNQFRVQKGEACNYTGMTINRGSFYIPEENRTTFLSKYYDHVFKQGGSSDLIERHSDLCCVLYDLDMKIDKESEERGYTREIINSFIEISTRIMKKYFDLPVSAYQCFVLEKDKPTVKKECKKDGVHLMFPYIVTEPSIQHLIRDEIVIEAKHLFEECLNTIEDIVDISVLDKNGWMLLGSSKIDGLPYNLTGIWSYENIEDVGNTFPNRVETSEYYTPSLDLVTLLSIRRFTLADITNFKSDMQDFLESWIDDFNTIQEEKNNIHTRRFHGNINKDMKVNMKTVQSLVSILSTDRAKNYEEWIELGFCLHTISDELLQTWIEFSERVDDYRETASADCSARWGKMRETGLGLGTLHMWAKADNYKAYLEIIQNDLEYFIVKTVNSALSNKDDAKDKAKKEVNISDVIFNVVLALKQKYYHYFICSSYEKKHWYEFEDIRWVEGDADVGLKRKIREDLYDDYVAVSTKYRKLSERFQNDHPNKEKYELISAEVFKVAQKLRDATFRKRLLEEASEQLYWSRDRSKQLSSSKFEEILDVNEKLIGMKNGVYDLEKQCFREARCEDYVSLSADIEYQEYFWNDEIIQDINTFISQVLTNKDVRDYVLQTFAMCLDGQIYNEHFHIYTGCHAKGSEILMHDGTIANVENVKVGDMLMGPDSKPREVHELVNGYSQMYEIIPSKGEPFVVNEDHIMVLKATVIGGIVNRKNKKRFELRWHEKDVFGFPVSKCKNFPYNERLQYRKNVIYYKTEDDARNAIENHRTNLIMNNSNYIKNGDVIEIPLKEYIKRMKKINGAKNYFLFKKGVDFPEKDVKIDPYMLGYWLGDGTSKAFAITTMDDIVIDYFDQKTVVDENMDKKVYHKKNNKAKTIYYSSKEKKHGKNRLLNSMKEYNIYNNKHIPSVYKFNNRQTRLELLAGLIDSDGHYNVKSKHYEITLKIEKLIDDTVYLARSLGFAVTKRTVKKTCTNNGKTGMYFNVLICGNNLNEIPVLIERKIARDRLKKKDPLRFGFKVNKLENDQYYGFKLNQDHLYLAGDFFVHHNCGSNGKSKILELFELSFGQYCSKLSIAALTQKRVSSSAATPEIARLRGRRFVVLQEPGENEILNVGLMKEMTGGDKIVARSLNKDPIEFKPQFNMILTCNQRPKIPSDDQGSWRRIRVVEFTSKFTANPDPNDPNQFMIDTDLTSKLKKWGKPFFWILTQYYKEFKKNGYKEPAEVTAATNEYQKEQDAYSEFVTDCLKLDKTSYADVKEVYTVFQEYVRYNNDQKPSKKAFEKYMNTRFGKFGRHRDSKCWKGFKIDEAALNENYGISENPEDELL